MLIAFVLFDESVLQVVEVEARKANLGKWAAKHAEFRSKNGIPADYCPWTKKDPRPKLTGVPKSERMYQHIDLSWAIRPKKYGQR